MSIILRVLCSLLDTMYPLFEYFNNWKPALTIKNVFFRMQTDLEYSKIIVLIITNNYKPDFIIKNVF